MEFNNLQFVRLAISRIEDVSAALMIFEQIPQDLFGQIKDMSIDIDLLKKSIVTILSNPTQLFCVLVDKENKIKGIFWANNNTISNCTDVVMFSIDKEYQFGDAMKIALEYINNIFKNPTVRVLETRTKPLEKLGFKKTKTMMIKSMEI